VEAASEVAEGNPLDRMILTLLILAGIIILMSRFQRVVRVLRMNWPLLGFFGYCAASTLWSATPGLAMKRWFKAIGDVVMVLIILTDRNRTEAIKRIIVRAGFLVIPLSVLLIEFYPNLGRVYSVEDGMVTYSGVTTNKNLLGVMCMLVGLGFVWLILKALHENRLKTRKLIALGLTLTAVLWLFAVINSMTPLVCFLMGSTLMLFVRVSGRRRPSDVHLAVGGMVAVAVLLFVFPEVLTSALHLVGRNSTLTGRTDLWKTLLSMDTHPWLGTGFESFWLGDRLNHLWSIYLWHPNEAHNGYLEVYLNLGWVGVALLFFLLISGYRNLSAVYQQDPEAGSLRLAYFAAALVYNFAEAGFRMLDPMWIFLLLAIVAIPASPRKELEAALDGSREFIPGGLLPEDEQVYTRIS
jgi:O-antigen ligase